MKVMLRLYRQHDMDLVGLHLHPNYKLGRVIKEALKNYVNGKIYKIAMPNEEELPKEIRKKYQVQIFLHDEKDKEVIEWLKTTTKNQRNSLIKNITRQYLNTLYLNGYRENSSELYDKYNKNNNF